MSVRYTTLVKRFGEPTCMKDGSVESCQMFAKAVAENRIITVHHRESDWCEPEWAELGLHSVNVLVRLIFPKPLPYPSDTVVLGVKKHFDPAECLKGCL